ncbi:hypothetical protein [Paenibacillus tyrfis]|uniref:hypothetical protein n=1 Tax=Paenibacillus tyrfis TaxID=1501230 RepID=UPI0015C5B1A8|nr:hypothetical protein [Paenibacillus tyrfis]
MEWTTNQVLSVGLIAFLAIMLVFQPSTGLTAKATNAQQSATAKLDKVVESYK